MKSSVFTFWTAVLAISACSERVETAAAPATPVPVAPASAKRAPTPPAAAVPHGAVTADGVPDKQPACDHSENPACAVELDPKVVAEHGPALALQGTSYGQGVTLGDSTPVSAIVANPEQFAGRRVRIEGEVTEVCKMRGCWMALKSDTPGKTIKFKVTDGVMVFPQSAIGKFAVAEGMVRKMQLDADATRRMLAHEAVEQGRPFDASAAVEPMTIVRIDGIGAVIRDRK